MLEEVRLDITIIMTESIIAEHFGLSDNSASIISLYLGLLMKTLLQDHRVYPQTLRRRDVMITLMI